MELKHIALSQTERQQIAGKISIGIQYDEVLDSVRNNLSSTEVSRLHLLKRKDLSNIAREFRLTKIRHRSDAQSVRIWVEMCRQEKSDIVRFIKFQEEEDSQHGRLAVKDFILVLMNDVQVHMLQQYGHYRVNCMDSTHGTNAYDFQLTTLLVIDDYGEGFPVAFCISSKVDTLAMEFFLEKVRTAIGGPVDGAIPMTDDAPAYANAWRRIMGPPDHHILCTWHIDRNWRKNLSKINHSTEVKKDVYKTLRVLLETDTKEQFHSLLESSLRDMEADEGMSEFLSYFRREYVSRPEVWAYSNRLGLHCLHNMHIEAFHRTLKHVFMQGRKV